MIATAWFAATLMIVCGCNGCVVAASKSTPSDPREIARQVDKLGGSVSLYGDSDLKEYGLPTEFKGAVGSIHLDCVNLANIDLEPLIPHDTLKNASFRGASIDSEQVALLRDCTQLEILLLESTQITDDVLEPIAEIPTLEMLHLDRCNITDQGLKSLYRCDALRTLTLLDTHVTKNGVAQLRAQLPGLGTVYWSTAPSEEVRQALAHLERNGASVTGSSTKTMAMFQDKGLTTRYMISFDEKWKPRPEGIIWLKSVASAENTSVTLHHPQPKLLEALGQVPRLFKLSVSQDAQLKDADLEPLARTVNIHHLFLDAPLLTEKGLAHLARIEGLAHLYLQRVPLSERELRSFNAQMTLKTIAFSHCELSSEVFDALSEIQSLNTIEFNQCKNVSPEDVKRLREKRPALTLTGV